MQGDVYSSSLLTETTVYGIFGELHGNRSDSTPKILLTQDLTGDKEKKKVYCNICLGILQFCFTNDGNDYNLDTSSKQQTTCLDNLAEVVANTVKAEGYQFHDFSVEISIPIITMANERAFW